MRKFVAVLAGGFTLAGCAGVSDWLPSMPAASPPAAHAAIRLESVPPGAEARISPQQACRTPCVLDVVANGDVGVTFSLPGYLPQSATISFVAPNDPREGGPQLTPTSILVELDPAPPPPPPPRKHRRVSKKRPPHTTIVAPGKKTVKKKAVPRTAVPPPPPISAEPPPPPPDAPAPAPQ